MRKISSDDFEAAMYALDKIRKSSGKKEKEHGFILHTDNFHRRYILIPEGQRKFLNICSWMGG